MFLALIKTVSADIEGANLECILKMGKRKGRAHDLHAEGLSKRSSNCKKWQFSAFGESVSALTDNTD